MGTLAHHITVSEGDVHTPPKGVFGLSNEQLQFYEGDMHQ
jgi:hypothetical protein